MNRLPVLSVVAPCYDEEDVLGMFLEALLPVLDGIGEPFEVILVDDGSGDRTFDIVRAWSERRPEVRGLQLSRNFGHQMALTAGMDAARGQAVITLDCDLQHPPALIPEMVAAWRGGAEVVLAERRGPGRVRWWKRTTSTAYYAFLSRLSRIRIDSGASDFRLLDRRVVAAFAACRETHRMLRGLVQWAGFPRVVIPFEAGARAAGRSKYTWGRMARFALDGFFSFSTAPLHAAVVAGFWISVLAVVYLGYVISTAVFRPERAIPGWASILGAVLLLGGVQLLFLGILGQYVGRVYEQVKERPLYVVRQEVPAREEPAPERP
jgi:dolichol-phosphate mannosyltransferase